MSDANEPTARDAVHAAAATVVIPAYKAKDTILRAVESALGQNGGAVRVVVVIDDQCDITKQRLDALNDPRVTVAVNPSNLGAPASRNRGLALVTTPYVAFLDADDYFDGDLIGPLVTEMSAAGAQIGLGPSIQYDRVTGEPRHFAPDYASSADLFYRWYSGGDNVINSGILWDTAFLRSIGAWDESLQRNQDGELALRAILLGASFVQSGEGAAVWSNDATGPRITTRFDNMWSLFDIVDKFANMRSAAVSDETRLAACAASLLHIAHNAYRAGADDIGAEALARRRELGFGNAGIPLKYRFSMGLRAVPHPIRERIWRAIHLGQRLMVSGRPR